VRVGQVQPPMSWHIFICNQLLLHYAKFNGLGHPKHASLVFPNNTHAYTMHDA
jgi:hypothetical protein